MPPNYRFQALDLRSPDWNLERKFDFIHGGLLFTIQLDFPRLMAQARASLRPGGWLEFKEYALPMRCDDGSVAGTACERWSSAVMQGAAGLGHDWTTTERYAAYMREAGFADVCERSFRLPVGGSWPADPRERELGAMFAEHLPATDHFWHATIGRGLVWSAEAVHKLLRQRDEEILSGKVHIYLDYRVIYGRKPETAED